MWTKPQPGTFDEYLAGVSPDKRAALERIRRIVKSVAPKAEECISYQLPAFRQGRVFFCMGAAANHCAIYGAITAAEKTALERFDTSKGTIRFQPDKPLPASLVRKIVKARLARFATAAETRRASRRRKAR